ncbi:hypothetical protein ACFQT0_09310 [Hymenobacter humi]|uniref:Uncharacterized protein n=1 Tax=Hymenobacter humi TaxID=1411620 RepID=A0ABW2U3X7_9BACT
MLLGTISLLGSCGGSDTSETKTASSPKGTKSTATAPAAPEAAPLRVSVFLEYSGGMKGFVPRGGADKPRRSFSSASARLSPKPR